MIPPETGGFFYTKPAAFFPGNGSKVLLLEMVQNLKTVSPTLVQMPKRITSVAFKMAYQVLGTNGSA
jgi:hypothetical protein